MGNKTDPKTEKWVCDLKKQGFNKTEIVDKTGVKLGTVKEILRRNGLTGTVKTDSTPDTENHAHPPANEGGANSTPQLDPSTQPLGRINPNLTKANTSHEIIQYVQFFRRRTKDVPYKLSDHDMVWAETNYGKRWADGVKMMIDATGLSAEAIQQVVDDYEKDVTEALERFNEKYNREHDEG